eukprot:30968-Pelagococcus_subviridis.AAC.2
MSSLAVVVTLSISPFPPSPVRAVDVDVNNPRANRNGAVANVKKNPNAAAAHSFALSNVARHTARNAMRAAVSASDAIKMICPSIHSRFK